MAQKSILSFFKTADQTISNETEKSLKESDKQNDEESPKRSLRKASKQNDEKSPKSKQVVAEDSPVKRGRSKRKIKCIESDDDSNDGLNEVVNGNSEENRKNADEHETNSTKSPAKVSVQINGEKKVNGKPAKKPKMKKTESEESEKQPESPIKMEIDNAEHNADETSKTNGSIQASPSCSTQNDAAEFIPKRKTARKQMRSVRSFEKNDVPIKAKLVQPNVEEKETNDAEITCTGETIPDNEQALPEKSVDTSKSENNNKDIDGESVKLDSKTKNCNNEMDKHTKSPSSSTKKSNSEKESENLKKKVKVSVDTSAKKSTDGRLKANRKETKKNTPLKSSAKNDSIQCFFMPLKKSSDSDRNEDAVKSVELEDDEESIDDKNETDKEKKSVDKAKNEADKGKKSVDKSKKKVPLKKSSDSDRNEDAVKSVELEDDEESIDDKNETDKEKKTVDVAKNEADKGKKSVDKSKKKEDSIKDEESIKEDKSKQAKNKKIKNKKEIIKSEPVENEDSPVKVTRSRKKRKCLDSDEEDEAEPSSVPVKMEIDTEVKPGASDKEEDISMSNESCSESKPDEAEKKVTSTSNENSPEKKSDASEKSVTSTNNEKSSKTSPKKKANTSSKNDGEKKFGVKSTSATGTVFDPSKSNYHPIEDACWKQNDKVPYLALARTLELIENTSGRLKTIEILSNFLRSVIVLSPNDFLQSVYLCLNRLAPEYEGIELGVGETLLMKAVAQATGRTLEKIKAEVAVKGDLGLVSESSRGNQRVMFAPPKLTVSSVFSKFLEIAKMSGNSAMAKKTDKIQSLFVACRDCEARYIVRSLSGKLRIGLAEQSVLTAIARAVVLTPPNQAYPPEVMDASKGMAEKKFKEFLDSQTLILKTAYCECPNYDLIIPVLLKEGLAALPKCCQLSPGRPLKPMLAHPTAGIDIVLERFDKNAFTCEFKYDGERAQIHMTENGEVTVFSRNQENNTSKYPDIISRIPKALKETTKSFILDSEAVAWDKETKQILPFQVLSTRKKKDAVESEIVVQVCIMAFDLLYLNGESLVKKSLKERRSLLHSSFQEVESEFMFAQYKDGNSAETMQEFLDESLKGNCEGLMVKALEVDASYEIAKRSHNWLKLKKDYLQGVGDTLDLVVIGGYFGKGKRTGNYGGFLLACYDDENEEFQSICKLGTGFKDENLEAHTEFLKKHTIKDPKSYYRFDHSLEPDVWFEAVQVWEIKCADLSISPVHKAAVGIVDPEKGISLRFPRFIRIRDDKSPESATNSAQIASMYQQQQHIQNTSNKNVKNDEDYY